MPDHVRLRNVWSGRYLAVVDTGGYTEILSKTLNTGWSSHVWESAIHNCSKNPELLYAPLRGLSDTKPAPHRYRQVNFPPHVEFRHSIGILSSELCEMEKHLVTGSSGLLQ